MIGSKQRKKKMPKVIKARRAFAMGTVVLLTAGLLVALAAASTTPVLADDNLTPPDNWDVPDNWDDDNDWDMPDNQDNDDWDIPDNWDDDNDWEPPENDWEGDDEDENEQEIEREVKVKVETDKVEVESKLEKENITGEIENKFEVEFKVSEEVEIKLKYEEEFEYEDNVEIEREMKLEFRVEFESIIEFVDNDNDGLYDEGEEVWVYELEDREFTQISYTTEIVDNVIVHKITTQTVDGVFKVTLYAAGEFATIGEEAVRPTEVKIDLEINNFPYVHENSKLALKTKLKSEMDTEEEKSEAGSEEKVEITSDNYGGFFSWKRTALVDGVAKEVRSTAMSEDPEEGCREFYLIYERGSSIVHDPKIGVTGGAGVMLAGISWGIVIIASIVSASISVGVTRTLIITHKDADGVCAAAIAKTSYPEAKVDFIDPLELPSKLGSVSGYDHVIVLDLGINLAKKAKTVKAFRNLSKNCNVTYIDHHLFPRGVTRRSLACDAVVHRTDASASELAWGYFRPPVSHDFIALLGAIGDYQANTTRMRKLVERYSESKAYSEASALEEALMASGDGLRQKVVEELVQGKWPLEIHGMQSRVARAMRQRSIIKDHVLNSAERVNGCAMFVKNVPFNATGFAAELLTTYYGVDVGIAAGLDDGLVPVSARRGNGADINLSTLLADVTSDLGGVGGGHAAAAGGRIPAERFDEFLEEIERHI